MIAVSVRDMRKSYGQQEAVRGISFEVPDGAFFAFLGPNGAGKSTTISVICSLLDHDSGEVEIFGKPSSDSAARVQIGVVFQDHMLDDRLTVRENISVRGAMYGLFGNDLSAAVSRAMEITGCSDIGDRLYGQLSGGQKRRADIARALVHSPKILLLDEPTTGLDPQSRKYVWDTVSRLNKESGITVFLTTHYMEEAADADDIVIIDKGAIVAHGTPAELKEKYSKDLLSIVPKDRDALATVLSSLGIEYTESGGAFGIRLERTVDAIPILDSFAGSIESFEVRMGTLDDAFINVTGVTE